MVSWDVRLWFFVIVCFPALLFGQGPPAGERAASAVQLPLSGRTGQAGAVGTSQSTVNAGGANSVNLINSTVLVSGPFQGSTPNGTATAQPLSLTLDAALKQGLQYNLGTVTSAQSIRSA